MSTARLLRLALLLQWALALAVLRVAAELPWAAAVPLAALTPALLTGLVLALEVAIGAGIDPQGAPLARLIATWFGEWRTSVRMFGWAMPFAARFPDPPRTLDPARPAVLLVHGYLCNRAVWRPLLASGRLDGCNVLSVDLEPTFGPIGGYSATLRAAIAQLARTSGSRTITVIGHSMGGLALRAALRAAPDLPVAQLITVGTPHAGTVFAKLGAGGNAHQMRRGSDWLRALAAAADAPPASVRWTCIASRDDNLVVPRASAWAAGAQALELTGVGHLALLADPRVWDAIGARVRAVPG